MDNNALGKNYGGELKLHQVETDAKRELDAIRAAHQEVIRQDESAISRAQKANDDPDELRLLTLQRYQHMHRVTMERNEQREKDPETALQKLKAINEVQQAYRDEQKRSWKWEEEAQLTIFRDDKVNWLREKERLGQELQANQQTIESQQETIQRLEQEALQYRVTIKSQERKLEASQELVKWYADLHKASTEE
jgi:hypothetical protein